MNRYTRKVRTSLATKVIFSTVLLSLGVVWLTGSALYSQLSDGVKQVNLETSLAEARSSFFNAQYQFLLVNGAPDSIIGKTVQDVIISSTAVSLNQDRKSIFLSRFEEFTRMKSAGSAPDYSTATDGLLVSSFPTELRKRVRSSDLVEYQYSTVQYDNRADADVLIAGRRIAIPESGNYELYLVYSLTNQNTTLSLIKSSLLLTGFALLFLIALITWLVVRQVVRPVRDAARIAQQFTQGDLNGDGLNDRLHIYVEHEVSYETFIYNAWGELLFEGHAAQEWDGTYKGTKVPQGVYLVKVNVNGFLNKYGVSQSYQGTLQIIY
mgnify:CR=1 FL=1